MLYAVHCCAVVYFWICIAGWNREAYERKPFLLPVLLPVGEYVVHAFIILFAVPGDCFLQLETIWADGSGKYLTKEYRLVKEFHLLLPVILW